MTFNRQVFLDTYTNYHFAKAHPDQLECEELSLPAPLVGMLVELEEAVRSGVAFSTVARLLASPSSSHARG
jgi:hypothetical protein